MKRVLFIILSVLLILVSAYCTDGEERLIRDSRRAVEELGGIYENEEGILISVYPYHGKKLFLDNISSVMSLGNNGSVPVYFAIPPRKMDAYSLPDTIDIRPHRQLFELAENESAKNNVKYIDLLQTLDGSGLYFATDHHWTSRGAYSAYREIVSAMGKIPLEEEAFTVKAYYSEYRGSDYNKRKGEYDGFDTIELYYPESYDDLKVTTVAYPYDQTAEREVMQELYYVEAADKAYDKYNVYFKGNTPFITIKAEADRETLLVIRDSFASALAPFLACHYNVVMIDPRFFPERLSPLVEEYSIDAILVLENMGSLTEHSLKFSY